MALTPHPPTPNYGLAKPTTDDLMSDFQTWLNNNWDKLSASNPPPSGTTLPTSGNFNLGDRFYKTDTKSIYILVCKDANWGWFWRPIHDAISPWTPVPSTALNLTWNLNATGVNPLSIAFDNRGKCYWRGVIGPTSGNITANTSFSVFKALPEGLRARQKGAHLIGVDPLTVGTDPTNLNSYQGARIFIFDDPINLPNIRAWGGTTDPTKVYVRIQYTPGLGKWMNP